MTNDESNQFNIYMLDDFNKYYDGNESILTLILIKHNTGREQIMRPSLYIFMKDNILGGGYKKHI